MQALAALAGSTALAQGCFMSVVALHARCEELALSQGRENGNGRAVRNMIEGAVRAQSVRLASLLKDSIKGEQLQRLEAVDVRPPPPPQRLGGRARNGGSGGNSGSCASSVQTSQGLSTASVRTQQTA